MNAPRESGHGGNTSGYTNLTYVTALAIVGLIGAKFGKPDPTGQNGYKIFGNSSLVAPDMRENKTPMSKGQSNLADFAKSAGN